MYNANKPKHDELPTSAQLIRSTFIAFATALVLLLTIVMPSEYGLDPTGLGKMLGLTEMGEIKTQLAAEAEADKHAKTAPVPEATRTPDEPPLPEVSPVETVFASPLAPAQKAEEQPIWRDEISLVLTPGQGIEIKLLMKADAIAQFEWTANGSQLNFDAHGNGSGQSISYEKGRGVASDVGEIIAAFDGQHGWFWRNRTDSDVTLTLRVKGDYEILKRVV